MSTTIYDTPPSWAPPLSPPICPQRLCNPPCPFWCLLPPPSPPTFFQEDPPSSSSTSLPPLVISVIGILASALLLLSYYAFVSRYCTSRNSQEDEEGLQQGRPASAEVGHSRQETFQVQEGLDEAVIRSIATCKYREGDGFVDGKECSVCLGEFREEEEVRLLPRCCHAFHVECIDQWLKEHTSCPVCRVNVPPVAMEVLMEARHSRWGGGGESCVVVVGEKGEEGSILHV